HKKYLTFKNRIVMIGCGSIGSGTLPLILRHFDISPDQITVITADERGHEEAKKYGVEFINHALTKENYRSVLDNRLSSGDFLVNVSVDVSCVDMMTLCQEKGALYIDTVVEPWGGYYLDSSLTASQRSNYALREDMLKLKKKYPNGATAVSCHGANPGMVNHFVKQALLDVARDTGVKTTTPTSREGWGQLAETLGIKVIHIAERDTQVSSKPKEVDEFVNTWSIDGFFSEGSQPAELGWGTHEKALPPDGNKHDFGSDAAIYLNRPGCTTRVRSWTPLEGPYQGFLITHNESISIADYLTLRDGAKVRYRPTCHYAYHPCDDAVLSLHELNGKNGIQQSRQRLMVDEIIKGMDELGVLLMGNKKGVYWYGSRLTMDQTRKLVPNNNATSLQVTIAVLSGMIWAIENPKCGIVEPEEMDFARVLEIATPYLGDVVGVWGDWSPLQNREKLFKEDLDKSDPWQFKNIRVA
ncbi:MAG: saccharopine dehydrogenase NADP-binding domain-containing protein, partial [Alphaproteobacteria bacterium]